MTQGKSDKGSGKKAAPEARKAGNLSKRWMMRSLLAAFLLIAGVYSTPRILYSLSRVSTDDAYIAGTIVPVVSEVKGRAAEVFVKDNQYVQAGAPLLEMIPEDYPERSHPQRIRVAAPISGRIAGKNVEAGKDVQPGQPLFSLVDDRNIWIIANFKEPQLEDLKVGQRVDIKVDSYPGILFKGRLDSFQSGRNALAGLPPPEKDARNLVKVVRRIPVKIVFDSSPDPSYPLWPGLSVVPYVDVSDRGEKF